MSWNIRRTQHDRSTLAICTAVILAAAVAVTAPWVRASEQTTPVDKPAAEMMMDHSKMGGMKHIEGMSMTGDVNFDFATNMRKHHQMGVSMARALIKDSNDVELVRLSRDIITAQNKEIAVLDLWLKANKKPVAMAEPKTK